MYKSCMLGTVCLQAVSWGMTSSSRPAPNTLSNHGLAACCFSVLDLIRDGSHTPGSYKVSSTVLTSTWAARDRPLFGVLQRGLASVSIARKRNEDFFYHWP